MLSGLMIFTVKPDGYATQDGFCKKMFYVFVCVRLYLN